MQKIKKLTTRDITKLALLIALNVVFARMLSFQLTESIKLSTTFIVIALTGAIFGPFYGAIAAAVADIVGIILFPSPYGIFLGFTLSAFIDGAIYGFLLYRRPIKIHHIVLAILTSTVIVSYGLNTLWLTITMNSPFLVIIQPRIIKSFVMIPIQIALLVPILKLYTTRIEKSIL